MTSKIFKRVIPMVLAGTMMLVVAMPMSASAHDWDHHDHDNGNHYGWYHRDRDDFRGWKDRDDSRRQWDRDDYRYEPRAYYPNNYYGNAPTYGAGYGPCANLTRLQNVYRHDRATGHPDAANDVARQMQIAEARCGGASYGGYNYGQGSIIGPLGNMFGIR